MIIENIKFRMHILSALSDEYMSKILESTSVSDKTVIEIMREHNMPHSTAYRKIKELLKYGLLVPYRFEIIKGKKIAFYKSLFRSIQIKYNGLLGYEVEAIPNSDALERLAKKFYDLDVG
jgi:predicted transcriptional regulator